MPNRIIKESICTSDSIDELSWFEEVMFYRLIVNCDDYGRFDGRIPVIKNRLFPLKENITAESVKDGINKLASAGLVFLYETDGKPYLYLPTWNDHQNVRAKRSKYPEPVSNMITSACKCNHVNANVPVIQSNPIQSESLSESVSVSESEYEVNDVPDTNVGNTRSKRFVPPTVDEVRAYCQDRQNGIDPQRFIDHYTSNGWMVGRTKMKDWQAAVRTWEQRAKTQPQAKGKSSNPFLDMLEEGDYE